MAEKEKSISNLPIKDELFLSPIEKYKIYGAFPYSMLINVILAITTTAQILIVIGSTTSYTRAEERFFHEMFVADAENKTVEYSKKAYLYSIDDLKAHFEKSINNFYSIEDVSLENLTYAYPIETSSIIMKINYFNSYYNKTNRHNFTKYFSIDNTHHGPFDESFNVTELKDMIKVMKYFTLNYTLQSYVPFNYADYAECFVWFLTQKYSFEQRSHFSVTLDIKREMCDDSDIKDEEELNSKTTNTKTASIIKSFFWIHVIVIILTMWNMFLTMKNIFVNAKIYWHLKSTYRNILEKVPRSSAPNEMKIKSKWDMLTSKDRNRIFSLWNVITLFGNLTQFFGALFSLMEQDDMVNVTEFLVGLGCFMAYIDIGRYLDYIREYATIFNTIKKSIPNVLRYFLGVLPIFLGFIFFGVAIFWRSERFASIPMAIVSLFAMMNGDSIYDIIKDLAGVNFFIGQIYAYTFGILFIAVVMNIFVSIIEEAYVASKIKNQNHWIYSFLKLDNDSNKSSENDPSKSLNEMTKDKRKICEIVRSKNILRDAINMEMSIDTSKTEIIDENDTSKDQDMKLSYSDKKIEKKDSLNFSRLSSGAINRGNSINLDSDLTKYTNKIDKAMTEAENIAKGVISSSESQMKKELKMFLHDHIAILENKIKEIQSKLN